MAFAPLQQFTIGGAHYLVKPDHRNAAPGKSQWKVTPQEEANIFAHAVHAQWIVDGVTGWGLYRPINNVAYLGVDQTHTVDVFIAKFVRDPANASTWHGYPVINTERSTDVPHPSVLGAWQQAKILPPAKVRKISRMQPCKL